MNSWDPELMRNLGLSAGQAEDAMKMMGEVMANAMNQFKYGAPVSGSGANWSPQEWRVEDYVRRAEERGLDGELAVEIIRDVHAQAAKSDMSDEWVLRTVAMRLKEAIALHVEGLSYSENEDTASLAATKFAEKIDPEGFTSWDEACAETLHVEGVAALIERTSEAREYGTSHVVTVLRSPDPGERSQCREDGILDVFAALLAGGRVLFRVMEEPRKPRSQKISPDGWYEATGKVTTGNMAHMLRDEIERRGRMGR